MIPHPESHVNPQFSIFSNWRQLSPADLVVYLAIGELGEWCRQSDIADLAGLSKRQVIRSIQTLEAAGALAVSRCGRQNVYRLAREQVTHVVTFSGDEQVTHGVTDSGHTIHTTESNSDFAKSLEDPDQMTLIENDQAQNLGALDIPFQTAAGDLAALGIRPDLTQNFRSAPEIVKRYSPAKILMFFDDDRQIAENLTAWRQAYDSGHTDLAGLTPALIWTKIVELQAPPPWPGPTSESPPIRIDTKTTPAPAAASESAGDLPEAELPSASESAGDSGDQDPPPPPESPPDSGDQDPPPAPDPLADVWRDILATLPLSPKIKTEHLAPTTLAAGDGHYIVTTPHPRSLAPLNFQLRHHVERGLAAALGGPVAVEFVAN